MTGENITPIAPDELASRASAAYGPRWQSRFAHEFGVAVRTVQRWARDGIASQSTARAVRAFLAQRARIEVSPPHDDGCSDVDDDAYGEVRPHIEALVRAMEAAGWHPAEAVTAIMAVAIDIARTEGGAEAVIETLRVFPARAGMNRTAGWV